MTGRHRARPGARPAHRALILDDEAGRRGQMRDGLLDHGVESEEAATLEEAVRRLSIASYDLVVCDVVLCDPPGAANPSVRGYLAVCFALARSDAPWVVHASSYRRRVHPGAILTNWRVEEVANLVYGDRGIPVDLRSDGVCPWSALRHCAAARPPERAAAVAGLARLPILRELGSSSALDDSLAALEDAAGGRGVWSAALESVREVLFPGASDAA